MRYGDSIKQSLKLLKAGVLPRPNHNYALTKWQRMVWNTTLWIWRSAVLLGLVYLLINLLS